uniref:Olfactory receptor n=1 Tax=Leptobrachium leishanense TaxID=445787 RepID=A0A8C5M841_9ANUR
MESGNRTKVTEFVLLGFSGGPFVEMIIVILICAVYVTLLTANGLLILAVSFDRRLHNSMYFFLLNLSLINLCSPSVTIPKMLVNFGSGRYSISLAGCAAQVFFYLILGESECILLVFMAYDRFVAICNPLRYSTIMSRSACVWMISATWTVSCVTSSVDIFVVFSMTFCNPNIINHFICEIPSLMQLSCSYNYVLNGLRVGGSTVLLLVPLVAILFSYIRISYSVARIKSGRYKAFSTCFSHLMVVTLFYGTVMVPYMRPRHSAADNTDKVMSVFCTIITPLLNPLIYSLRNKDVLRAMKQLGKLK